MKKIIYSSIVFILAFTFFYELNNVLPFSSLISRLDTRNSEAPAQGPQTGPPEKTVYFIGDSYAKTDYARYSYPSLFKKYFDSLGLNFVDLSRNGTNINYHKYLLDSIEKKNPAGIIYFYNVSDLSAGIDTLTPEKNIFKNLAADQENQNDKPAGLNIGKKIDWVRTHSATVVLIKDILQYAWLNLFKQPLPGSNIARYSDENMRNREFLAAHFNSLKSGKTIIFINYPFFLDKAIIKSKWPCYRLFDTMKLKESSIRIYQSCDLDFSKSAAVSWRNGHPNQENILETYKFLTTKFAGSTGQRGPNSYNASTDTQARIQSGNARSYN